MKLSFILKCISVLSLALVGLAGCSGGNTAKLQWMTGLGYTPGGKELVVATDDGPVRYTGGGWQVPDLPGEY